MRKQGETNRRRGRMQRKEQGGYREDGRALEECRCRSKSGDRGKKEQQIRADADEKRNEEAGEKPAEEQ